MHGESQDGAKQRETVLVTGGSGYVGGWIIVTLLRRGYHVRTTLRSLSKEGAVRSAIASQVPSEDRLSFFAADLLSDNGWESAVAGCDYVLHVASPLGGTVPKGTDLVSPAREGTLRVLRAASRKGVRRVVITSSTDAARPPRSGRPGVGAAVDESVWTDPEQRNLPEYPRSKTLAERAAWGFIEEAQDGMTLATILPGLILGPVIAREFAGSVEIVSRMLAGKFPALPRVGFNIVDVRDLADLHLKAMVTPEAAGQRFLAAADFLWMSDIAKLLREHFSASAAKVPKHKLPDFVLRLAALLGQQEAVFLAPMLGVRTEIDGTKARRLLDWRPRPASAAVLDCAESLIRQKLV